MKQKRMRKILFLFSFFFLFSFIVQPLNVHAETKQNVFSTNEAKNDLKKTGATPDSASIPTTATKNPTTTNPPQTGGNSGNTPTSTTAKKDSTTTTTKDDKKDDKKDNKKKASDEGKEYPADIDKPLEKVCYDMVRDTLNLDLGKDMKEVISGSSTNEMMQKMQSTYTDIVSPVGEALIVLFFLVEMIDKTTKENFSMEHFFKLMLKIAIAKLLIENGWDILTNCITIGSNLATAITTNSKALDGVLEDYAKDIQDENTIGNLGMIIQWFLPWVFAWVSRLVCIVVCWGRMIELGVRAVAAPIAMADIFQDGTHSGGFRYLRKFLAVCLQAFVILIIIQIAGIIQGIIIGKNTITMFKAVVVGLTTCMMVVRSQQFANDLVGA